MLDWVGKGVGELGEGKSDRNTSLKLSKNYFKFKKFFCFLEYRKISPLPEKAKLNTCYQK